MQKKEAEEAAPGPTSMGFFKVVSSNKDNLKRVSQLSNISQ